MNEMACWIEVRIVCDDLCREAVGNFFLELGSTGLVEAENELKGYFPLPDLNDSLKTALKKYIQNLRDLGHRVGELEIRPIPSEDWSVGWRAYFKPVNISDQIIVKPPWEVWAGPEPVIIDIMPRMAFGTGTHETSQLCLEFLEKYLQSGESVLDLGSGSGILAIGAVKLGAAHVLGIEVDPEAVTNTKENVQLNDTEKQVTVLCGTLDCVQPQPFDIVVANINWKVLEALLPQFTSYLKMEGTLILSGILNEEAHLIRGQLNELQYAFIEEKTLGEWTGLVLRRSNRNPKT